MEGLTAGRIVHYVLPDGPSVGEHRPAMVVKVWGSTAPYPVQLVVFLDGTNDDPLMTPYGPTLTKWATSVTFDATGKQPRTWHWIERA